MTQDMPDIEPTMEWLKKDMQEPVQYIRNMQDGSTAGYKYFAFDKLTEIGIEIRGDAEGYIEVRTALDDGIRGTIPIHKGQGWKIIWGKIFIPDGVYALYFTFRGKDRMDFRRFFLE